VAANDIEGAVLLYAPDAVVHTGDGDLVGRSRLHGWLSASGLLGYMGAVETAGAGDEVVVRSAAAPCTLKPRRCASPTGRSPSSGLPVPAHRVLAVDHRTSCRWWRSWPTTPGPKQRVTTPNGRYAPGPPARRNE
jgi:hypothetical protein